MVRFTQIIDASIEWVSLVLFRPFNPKKWLILAFIALLAGRVSSCNLSLGGNSEKKPKQAQAQEISQGAPAEPVSQQTAPVAKEMPGDFLQRIKGFISGISILIFIVLLLLGITIMLIMSWLWSRFAFIFMEDVIKNNASIKMPFKSNKMLGNSLFLFTLAFLSIFLVCFVIPIAMCIGTLVKLGAFDKAQTMAFKQIFFTCLPYGLWLLLLIFIGGIVSLLTNDFVLAVMFRDKIKILQAWPRALAIFRANKRDFVKYFFIKIGLGICSQIVYVVLSLLGLIGLILPAGILAGIFYFISLLIPKSLHFTYGIILFIIVLPIISFLFYCLMCLNLPFAVFYRALSLKFIGRLDPRYNLFRYIANEEAGP